MPRRILFPSLVLLTVVTGGAVLESDDPRAQHPAPASEAEAARASPMAIVPELESRPALVETRSISEPSTFSEPLARQRDRLHHAESRLRARGEQARGRHAPQPTQRALDDHLARVQQRLAALERAPS